jgi:UDP-2-acetamido-3-amino-2,3-dideoxy-glucuronate N-acetyltransferase
MFWNKTQSNIQNCEIGKDSIVHSHTWIGNGVKIGERVKIQPFVFIPTGIEIEDDVFIGPGVVFANDKYPPSNGKGWTKTIIKKGVAIGANATILPGITINENSLIGAGSVVTKDVPPNEVWVGNPATKLRDK